MLPHLNIGAKKKRVQWAETFWIFWYSAKAVCSRKKIFVVVHMDEKWFYAIRSRSNCKELTAIGLEPEPYFVQHKNHIGKLLFVVVTAYVLCDK